MNLRKDIDLYINSLFFDRIDELRYMQRVLHEVIETNADDGEIQIKAVTQLQTITNQLNQYFIQLPDVAKVGTTIDVNTLFPPFNNSNNTNANTNPSSGGSSNTTTITTSKNSNDKNSWWCSACRLMHKNEFGLHCIEAQVGKPEESEPGYFGGTPAPDSSNNNSPDKND